MKLSKALEVAFDRSGEAVKNLRQTNFWDKAVDRPSITLSTTAAIWAYPTRILILFQVEF